MATTYSSIYDEFLDKITDPDLLLLSEEDQEATKRAYLEYAVKKCKRYIKDYNLDNRTVVEVPVEETETEDVEETTEVTDGIEVTDDAEVTMGTEVTDDTNDSTDSEDVTYEGAFDDDLSDDVIVMLTEYMVEAWLKPYMLNADLLRLHMNTKDFNTTSPANLVEKVGARYDEARHRARSLRNEYTYKVNDVSMLSTSKKT